MGEPAEIQSVKPRPVSKGDKLTAATVNEIIGAVRRVQGGVKPPQQVKPTASPQSNVRQFEVVGVRTDYLICNAFDGTNAGAEFAVAMPYLLRRTPFDGSSRNGISYDYTSATARTATQDTTTETQVIVPSYVAGDIIYGVKGVIGGTDTYDADDAAVEWLDMNVDGRAWAKS